MVMVQTMSTLYGDQKNKNPKSLYSAKLSIRRHLNVVWNLVYLCLIPSRAHISPTDCYCQPCIRPAVYTAGHLYGRPCTRPAMLLPAVRTAQCRYGQRYVLPTVYSINPNVFIDVVLLAFPTTPSNALRRRYSYNLGRRLDRSINAKWSTMVLMCSPPPMSGAKHSPQVGGETGLNSQGPTMFGGTTLA